MVTGALWTSKEVCTPTQQVEEPGEQEPAIEEESERADLEEANEAVSLVPKEILSRNCNATSLSLMYTGEPSARRWTTRA